MVKIQEAEKPIITHYEVFVARPHDSDLLVPAVEAHEAQFGPVPQLVAADGAFSSQDNERTVQHKGVKWLFRTVRRAVDSAGSAKRKDGSRKHSAGESSARDGSVFSNDDME